jgi:hypothetical protein
MILMAAPGSLFHPWCRGDRNGAGHEPELPTNPGGSDLVEAGLDGGEDAAGVTGKAMPPPGVLAWGYRFDPVLVVSGVRAHSSSSISAVSLSRHQNHPPT